MAYDGLTENSGKTITVSVIHWQKYYIGNAIFHFSLFTFILHSLILHFSLLTFHFSLSIPPLGG